MKFITLILCTLYFLHSISAHNYLEGIFQDSLPCFKLAETTCNSSFPESYQAKSNKVGFNKPTTLAYLFTPDNPDVAEPLHLCGGKLPNNTLYDPNAKTEVFIHGWLDGVCRTAWMREMYFELQKRGRYNVILVDWTWGNALDYFYAGNNCKIVGEQIGFLIDNIMKQTGATADKFHIIGHSLGAIAASELSRYLKSKRGNDTIIRRITGLDCAGPPYLHAPPEERLTYRDAETVDIIHSNGGMCFANAIGDIRPLGHADFYPNGGRKQSPGCYIYSLLSLLKLDLLYGVFGLLDFRICPHTQSIQYYKASINSGGCEFIGVESSSYKAFLLGRPYSRGNHSTAVMGMNYERSKNDNKIQRLYFLITGSRCPYYDDSYLIEQDRKPECENPDPVIIPSTL